MLNLFERTNWESAYFFLTAGSPPLITRLLAINTIFLILIVLRRVTGTKSRKVNTSYVIQGLLLFGNIAVLMQSQLMPVASRFIAHLKFL